MRVLILNYEFPPLGGGGANATKYILREFKDYKNLKIDLVTSSEKNKNEIIQFGKNIKIYKINVKKKEIHHWRDIEVLRYMYHGLKLCKKLNKKNKYDLCHAFFTLPSGYIPFKLKIPYISSIRGSDVPGYNDRFKLHYKLITNLTKKIWKNSKFVISNSEGLKDLALKIHTILGCRHYSMVDFLLDSKNEPWFLELNTLPGMTETSLLPKSLKADGIKFKEIIRMILNEALRT